MPPGDLLLRIMPAWGVLCLVWFFFVFKARTETPIFDRERLETRGSFRPLVARKLKTALIREIVRKPVGLEHMFQETMIHEGLNRRKMLFAEGRATRDLGLAVQADEGELEWLRGVLESHRRKLQPDTQRQP